MPRRFCLITLPVINSNNWQICEVFCRSHIDTSPTNLSMFPHYSLYPHFSPSVPLPFLPFPESSPGDFILCLCSLTTWQSSVIVHRLSHSQNMLQLFLISFLSPLELSPENSSLEIKFLSSINTMDFGKPWTSCALKFWVLSYFFFLNFPLEI